ncbi:MAG: hypothetical protein IJ593_09990 [Lachnospiraceae bacterium]|nr:hypothetical protein [Lachnospiraceae bacterium]
MNKTSNKSKRTSKVLVYVNKSKTYITDVYVYYTENKDAVNFLRNFKWGLDEQYNLCDDGVTREAHFECFSDFADVIKSSSFVTVLFRMNADITFDYNVVVSCGYRKPKNHLEV